MRTSVSRFAIGIPFVCCPDHISFECRAYRGAVPARSDCLFCTERATRPPHGQPTVTGAPWSVRRRARPSSAAVGDAADLVHVDVDHAPGTAGGALVRDAVVLSGAVRVTTPVDVQSSQQRPTAAGPIAMPPSARSLAVSRTDHG